MRLRTLLPALLVLALAVPANAQDRRKPRVTDPDAATDDGSSSTAPKKKRKHATSVEDDGSTPPADDTPPPSKKKSSSSASDDDAPPPSNKKASSYGDDEGSAPSKKSSFGDDEEAGSPKRARSKSGDDEGDEGSSRHRRSSSDEGDEERPSKRIKTAEEELDPTVEKEEELSGDDEPGHGIAAEFVAGPIFLSGALGTSTVHAFSGLVVSYQVGRALFAPEWEFLHNNFILEFSYLGANAAWGTDEVRVNSWNHYLTLDVLIGFPVPPVLFYAKVGPALMVMPTTYDVQGAVTSFSGVKGGLVYGIGIRSNWYLHRYIGFAWRVEVTRYRRGYLDDTLITAGVGVCF